MAFLNTSLLSNGTESLDTASPLAEFQQLRQKKAESKALIDKSSAESAASQFDLRKKRFDLLQRLAASSAANPTVASFAANGDQARDLGLITPEENQIYQSYGPQTDAEVPAYAAGSALGQMADGGQFKAMEPTRSTLNLNDRQVVVRADPVTHQQTIEGQYRMGVSPSYFVSDQALPGLAQQNRNPDPRIYGGDVQGGSQGNGLSHGVDGQGQTAPLKDVRTSWAAGADWGASPQQMTLADLYATSQASGHPLQHVYAAAKAKGVRVVR